MSVIENFLVNTSNFDKIIQTLIKDQDVPSVITDTYFKSLGFQNPSDLLVIHLMKGLNILEEDGSTTDRFNELKNPSTTQKAIAKGVVEAYEGLFRMEPQIHKMQHDELQKIFSEVFAGQKSELIFKYMANTFNKLVSYAGTANIEHALDGSHNSNEHVQPEPEEKQVENEQNDVAEAVQESAANTHTNGVHSNGIDSEVHVNGKNGLNGHTTDQTGSEPAVNPGSGTTEPEHEAPKEEKGTISFEDLVGLNSADTTEPKFKPISKDSSSGEETDSETKQELTELPEPGESPIGHDSAAGSIDNNESAEEPHGHSEEDNPLHLSDQDSSETTYDVEKPEEKPTEIEQHAAPQSMPVENTEPLSSTSSKVKEDLKVQKALIKKADLLYKLNRYESLLPELDQIIAYYDRADEPFLKEAVSTAVIRRAFVLYNLNKFDQALPALDRVITRFSYSDNKNLYEHASLAMLYKASILEERDQPEQVLPLYNSIIERLGHVDNPELKEQIDEIFLKRLDMLLDAGRTEEVLAAADQLIERFKNSPDKLKYLEEAMFKKAEILENLNKYEEALEAYSYFLEKFGQNISTS